MALLDALYALVIFLSAFLLFLVEPMTAKRLLPLLGGSSAVWITCLVFFQCALLAGYLYAHLVVSRLRRPRQALAHMLLLALALCSVGVHIHANSAEVSWRPLLTTLKLVAAMVGLPFVALAATTPLLQSWHSSLPMYRARPAAWRFFALSNFGSILALVLYPWVIEPNLTLHSQRLAWTAGFILFALACMVLAWRRASSAPSPIPAPPPAQPTPPTPRTPASHRALWILLPAASSMLLCAITGHLSQNVAAVPLLWIVPLIAYLLSFVITFAGPRFYLRSYALRVLALAMATIGYLLIKPQRALPLIVSVPVYVGALFVFCYFCHGELYRLRPPGRRSTGFYLRLSLGSALGAIVIGVAAPMLTHANYDLAASLVVLVFLALAATWSSGLLVRLFWFAAGTATLWAVTIDVRATRHDSISMLRSFYGSLSVRQTYAIPGPGIERALYHGTIEHGIQIFNDKLRDQPTTYYAPDSGVGLALRFCCGGRPRRIGVVGLGVGTLAAYANPGDSITFYEIDPLVLRLAEARFTYLRDCRGAVDVVLGDARLEMQNQPPQNYDVLAIDAFSGDAIPVHLLTAQAIELYRVHLKPNGILAFHISSQYLDLAPVLAAQARHAGLMAVGVHSLANDEVGEFQADWVLMSADPDFFHQSEVAIASYPLLEAPGEPLWTDDFNSLLPLVRWTGFEASAAPLANRN